MNATATTGDTAAAAAATWPPGSIRTCDEELVADGHSRSDSSALLADDDSHCSELAATGFTTGGGNQSCPGETATKDNDKACRVCGDLALGHNFGVVTCESCKAFFRRTATKEKALKCVFASNCHISVKTRRFCSACRFRKCFSMGMRKDLILDENERQRRRKLLEQNKVKKLERLQHVRQQQLGNAFQPTPADTEPTAASASAASDTAAAVAPATVDGLFWLDATSTLASEVASLTSGRTEQRRPDVNKPSEQATDRDPAASTCSSQAAAAAPPAAGPLGHPSLLSPSSSWLSPPVNKPAVPSASLSGVASLPPGRSVTLLPTADYCSPSRTGAAYDKLNIQLASYEVSSASPSAPPERLRPSFMNPNSSMTPLLPGWGVRRRITDGQSAAIAMVHTAYITTLGSFSMNEYEVSRNRTDVEMTINFTEAHVRRIAKFAKTIPEFATAPEAVQHSLLKNAVIPCSLLYSAAVYEPDLDCWLDSSGCRLRVSDVFDGWMASLDPQALARHRALINSIKQSVPVSASSGKGDISVYALMHAILLLSPEHAAAASGVGTNHDVAADVSDAQQRYVGLLSSHLQATVSYAGAAEVLPVLMQGLTKIKQHAGAKRRQIATVCDRSRVEPLLQEVYGLHLTASAEPSAEELPVASSATESSWKSPGQLVPN